MSEEVQANNGANSAGEQPVENDSAETILIEQKEQEIEAPSKKKIKNTMEEVEKLLLGEQSNNKKFPNFQIGDTVRVYVKIIEGDKQRIQPYEGIVMADKHGGIRRSFTVRRVSYGVAIERVFPYYSPYIEKIELVRKGRVRRAKLYYLRGRFGRSAVVTEKVD